MCLGGRTDFGRYFGNYFDSNFITNFSQYWDLLAIFGQQIGPFHGSGWSEKYLTLLFELPAVRDVWEWTCELNERVFRNYLIFISSRI
jgi:hypothetical protein